jgi:hypothetical protein
MLAKEYFASVASYRCTNTKMGINTIGSVGAEVSYDPKASINGRK